MAPAMWPPGQPAVQTAPVSNDKKDTDNKSDKKKKDGEKVITSED